MSSIALGPRALGPGIGDRPAREGVGAVRDEPSRATASAMGPGDEVGRWEGAAEFVRILAATVALYAVLIALPFLALVPVVVMGAFLGVIATLFGGIS